jgi:hypothetical protein
MALDQMSLVRREEEVDIRFLCGMRTLPVEDGIMVGSVER